MAEPNKIERDEAIKPEVTNDIRKPAEGEELTQSDQEDVAGGYVRF
ncbi:MAG TPA: hypothetical protein VK789_03440 [Bryobacteraceae bacterium]|jgi:hypothetical protein|nr:hypothetical protein [Bryobacteraceae bacterium]